MEVEYEIAFDTRHGPGLAHRRTPEQVRDFVREMAAVPATGNFEIYRIERHEVTAEFIDAATGGVRP